jgi:hypothetical protein
MPGGTEAAVVISVAAVAVASIDGKSAIAAVEGLALR